MNNISLNKIKDAALLLSKATNKTKNLFLKNLAEAIYVDREVIILANKKDVKKAEKGKLPAAFISRLKLDNQGLNLTIEKLAKLGKMNSGIGANIEIYTRKDGLRLKKVRVPIGVIFVIYESRPEVTVDTAALCIKSGNAAILKGGIDAKETNKVLYKIIIEALKKSEIDVNSVYLIDDPDRKITNTLIIMPDYIDLVIARGGYAMVKAIQENSRIPVLAHSAGGARIYVDKSADLGSALKIIINAKTGKPAACNSVDTVLVHQDIAEIFLPGLYESLKSNSVKLIKNIWDTEFLDLKISVKIIKDKEAAVKFINKYSKKHSEGIIAGDKNTVDYFIRSVDAAALFVNCSPRLHDGYEFGLGSEMGIATGKLHARGPVGLRELTTYKWIAEGEGHVRK